MIDGEFHGEKGKGFPSRKRIFFIALDSKARLVLPLEIREAIGIENSGRILISVSSIQDGTLILSLAKSGEIPESRAYSRNGSYARRCSECKSR